jgi:hypothetical protein
MRNTAGPFNTLFSQAEFDYRPREAVRSDSSQKRVSPAGRKRQVIAAQISQTN